MIYNYNSYKEEEIFNQANLTEDQEDAVIAALSGFGFTGCFSKRVEAKLNKVINQITALEEEEQYS